VTDGSNVHPLFVIEYSIDDSIIPDPNSPKIVLAPKLPHPSRTRFLSQVFDPFQNPLEKRRGERFEFLACRAGKGDGIFTH
jgi:hypothetical protein